MRSAPNRRRLIIIAGATLILVFASGLRIIVMPGVQGEVVMSDTGQPVPAVLLRVTVRRWHRPIGELVEAARLRRAPRWTGGIAEDTLVLSDDAGRFEVSSSLEVHCAWLDAYWEHREVRMAYHPLLVPERAVVERTSGGSDHVRVAMTGWPFLLAGRSNWSNLEGMVVLTRLTARPDERLTSWLDSLIQDYFYDSAAKPGAPPTRRTGICDDYGAIWAAWHEAARTAGLADPEQFAEERFRTAVGTDASGGAER